jgi:hypothetical protein
MISKLKEEGLWDSLAHEGHMLSSTDSQPSPAVIEPSHPTDEHTVNEERSRVEETGAEELASSLELGKDRKTFIALAQRKCLQLDLEFSGNQFEGMTCFLVCSVNNPKRDLRAIGYGTTKVRFDLACLHHCLY